MIENKLSPIIKIRDIVLEQFGKTDNQTKQEYNQDKYGSMMNIIGKDPILWYNGILIAPELISSFYLDTTGQFPILKAWFNDSTNEMHNRTIALDNTVISLYIDSRTKDSSMKSTLAGIRMDFKLVSYGYLDDSKTFFVQGIPDVDDYYIQTIDDYSNKTSFDTLKECSQKCKLGFRSNVSNTNDKMLWQNYNLENYKFISNTTKYAYKSDSSFFTSYLDINYYINFIDVEKELNESIDIDGVYTYGNEGIAENELKIDKLYIVNSTNTDIRYNNIYDKFEFLNKSTAISINEGYRKNIHYYDKTGNWEQKAGTFLRFTIETNTSDKGIILKSFPNDTNENGFFKQHTKNVYISPLDIDNTHKNYNYAYFLNNYNMKELDKMLIKVTMSEVNFNFYKYQKIQTYIIETKTGDSISFNERLSGGWIIRAINYYYDSETGLKQELIMAKRELSAGDYSF